MAACLHTQPIEGLSRASPHQKQGFERACLYSSHLLYVFLLSWNKVSTGEDSTELHVHCFLTHLQEESSKLSDFSKIPPKMFIHECYYGLALMMWWSLWNGCDPTTADETTCLVPYMQAIYWILRLQQLNAA